MLGQTGISSINADEITQSQNVQWCYKVSVFPWLSCYGDCLCHERLGPGCSEITAILFMVQIGRTHETGRDLMWCFRPKAILRLVVAPQLDRAQGQTSMLSLLVGYQLDRSYGRKLLAGLVVVPQLDTSHGQTSILSLLVGPQLDRAPRQTSILSLLIST